LWKRQQQLGAGGFAVTLLVRHRVTGELVAAKLIERTEDFDVRYVTREILNHRRLRHETIVRFLKVVLTPTHLAIFMEVSLPVSFGCTLPLHFIDIFL